MTAAVLAAGFAGALAALAIGDLAGVWARRRRRRRRVAGRLVAALSGTGRGLGTPAPSPELRERLAAAGAPLAPDEFAALRVGLAVAGCLAILPAAASLPGAAGLLAPGVVAGGAYLGPGLWLRRRTTQRARRLAGEVADVADLLRVAVEAGHSIRRALAEVGRRHSGLLAAELTATAEALELGVPRAPALEALRRRLPDPAAVALVAALERSERLGTAPAVTLAALAADARAAQRRAIAERAARAAPQIQLVVALLLVPSALLLVAAALLPALGV